MSIPLMVHGESIAEAWERSLLACYKTGVTVRTQYDIDPNTGYVHPPSKDCMMTMVVDDPLSEPRLHVCLIGGPAELGDYRTELIDGVRDHWVKRRPSDKTWAYTYSGRIHRFGDRLNAAAPDAIFNIGEDDPENPWVGLAYVRDIIRDDGSKGRVYQDIAPIDQVQVMIDTLAEAPFTRRAVAETSFPPLDVMVDDPPCLRYIWCRGYTVGKDNHVAIDMHTHWRSRDGLKAALFNMFGMTELLRTIIDGVQAKLNENADELLMGPCPICGGHGMLGGILNIESATCGSCGSNPFLVTCGRYVDVSDSYHIYGQDLEGFENGFLKAVESRSPEDLRWDLEERGLLDLVEDGAARARESVASRDERDGLSNTHRPDDAADYTTPIETLRAMR
jgi:thymidylate synthase